MFKKKTASDGLVKSSCATSRLGDYRLRFKESFKPCKGLWA